MRAVILALALTLAASVAAAADRIALVIGNDDYEQVTDLRNAVADAELMGAVLEQSGFDVVTLLDGTRTQMLTALAQVSQRLTAEATVVLFYAGHGIEIAGANYLLPTDVPNAGPGNELLVRQEALALDVILAELDRAGRVVVILDACRDNPFTADGRSIGAQRGLARLQAPPRGTFIVYSAGAGEIALDRLGPADTSPNGVFTRVFATEIGQGGTSLREAVLNTRQRVATLADSVGHAQFPAYYDQMQGDLYFVPAVAGTDLPTPRETPAPEAPPAADAREAPLRDWCTAPGLAAAERTICTDRELAALDARLAQALARSAMPAAEQNRWRRDVRDACGADRFCIGFAIQSRIDAVARYRPNLRPWCREGTLNPAEEAICTVQALADLDAQLAEALAASPMPAAEQAAWQRDRRDACGASVFCIGAAIRDRIAEVAAYRPPLRRPWCDASRLNPTEETICGSDALAALDAEMARLYAALPAPDAAAQNAWRIGSRDACGRDAACIRRAMDSRIAALQARPPAAHQGVTAPPGQCHVQVASRETVEAARAFIRERLGGFDRVRVIQSANGLFAVVVDTVPDAEARDRIAWWIAQGRIPGDSYCTRGESFLREIAWAEGGETPRAPVQSLWVAQTSSGYLNLRTGPGTGNPVLRRMDIGTRVEPLERSDRWVRLRMPDGTVGWAHGDWLSTEPPGTAQCQARVTGVGPLSTYDAGSGAGFLAVRDKPSVRSGRLVSELYLGDEVDVLDRNGNWARVTCRSGQCLRPYRGAAQVTGWASTRFLAIRCR